MDKPSKTNPLMETCTERSNGNVAIATPEIPNAMLSHSRGLTLRLIQIEVRILISSGFRAIASAVIPAATDSNAMMNKPRYNAVLNVPKTETFSHSFPTGSRCFSKPCTYPSSKKPATKNRIQKKVRGSTESNPNLPAIEADAQSIAKETPVKR